MDTILSYDTTLTLLINGSDCLWLDHFVMFCTKAQVWALLYLALLYVLFTNLKTNPLWKSRTLWITLAGVILCVLISDQVASSIFKPLVCRLRPTQDPAIMDLVDTVNGYRGGRYGFFSSHAANTMSVAVFFSLLLRRRLVTCVLGAWCLLNCWTRLYLGVHFVGDILVGLLFGALVGYGIYSLVGRCLKHEMPVFKDNANGIICAGFSAVIILGAIYATFI